MIDRRHSLRNLLVIGCSLRFGGAVLGSEPGRWPVELKVDRFCIRCDFKLETQQSLVQELRGISRDLQRLLRLPPHRDEIYVVLFESDKEYRRYMANYFPTVPQRRAIFIQDRGPGMLFMHWHEEVAVDLRHEVTHALINTGKQALPLWLDEGLAEYFEVAHHGRFSDHPYRREVTELAGRGEVRTIQDLQREHDIAHFSDADYRDSWAWVHYLIHRRADTRQLLIRYLQEHAAAQPAFDLARGLQQIAPEAVSELEDHFASL